MTVDEALDFEYAGTAESLLKLANAIYVLKSEVRVLRMARALDKTETQKLKDELSFWTDERECSVCGDIPRDHDYNTCAVIAAGR